MSNLPWTISRGTPDDLDGCKFLVDKNRLVFGFVSRPILQESLQENRMLVARLHRGVIGFVRFNPRKKGETMMLYDIVVSSEFRGAGIGRALIGHLRAECHRLVRSRIRLACPENLPSNGFYRHLGFKLIRTVDGKKRRLCIWELELPVPSQSSFL